MLHLLKELSFLVGHFPEKGDCYPRGVPASQQTSWEPRISSRFQPFPQCREQARQQRPLSSLGVCGAVPQGPKLDFNALLQQS